MVPLPIDPHLPAIISELARSRSLVVIAPPGAGKTTRVPPAMVRAGLLSKEHPNLVMLQPRRVAARAAAMRIADENGWTLGDQVGYHVRFDKRVGPRTRIRVLTEGILTRQLVDDPFLEGVGAVLLDEFHERSLHTDMAIALLKEARQTVRPDLLIVVMSATLSAGPIAGYLDDCPIVDVPGRVHPVQIEHSASPVAISLRDLPAMIDAALSDVLRQSAPADPGDILIFLPGVDEIRRTARQIAPLAHQHDLLVLPLHGSLSSEDQLLALRPARQRKVILATNIAQTSLTIDGVRTVIDSGLARVAGYDAQRGLDRLELERISKASATQRAGRAGRTAPGRAIRLWSASQHEAMEDYECPEIHRVDLAATVLSLHAWGKPDPRQFGWFEPPPETTMASAERLLTRLGALDAAQGGRITELGRRMLALPVHPRLARLLLAAGDDGMLQTGATLASLLSEKDIFLRQGGLVRDRATTLRARSDLLVRLDALHAGLAPAGAELDREAVRQVARVREELLRIARNAEGARAARSSPGETDDAICRLALLAYPDRVCRRRESDPSAAVMVGGGGVRLAVESAVRDSEFFIAIDARHDQRSASREALVRIASAVEPQWLEELFPQSVRREKSVEFDPARQHVVGVSRISYLDLVLREDRDGAPDPDEAAGVLLDALSPTIVELVRSSSPAAAVLDRVGLLRRSMPEHAWPTFDEEELKALLRPHLRGARGLDDIRRLPLASILCERLPYPLDRILDREAPDSVTVPSGSNVRIDYSVDPPILRVRLQELFGWTQTPRIAAGRVKLVLHILGPNYRPVQVTDDLSSFWRTTYAQVRKDLRARYPRHAWPDDPLAAKPEKRPRRRA